MTYVCIGDGRDEEQAAKAVIIFASPSHCFCMPLHQVYREAFHDRSISGRVNGAPPTETVDFVRFSVWSNQRQ